LLNATLAVVVSEISGGPQIVQLPP